MSNNMTFRSRRVSLPVVMSTRSASRTSWRFLSSVASANRVSMMLSRTWNTRFICVAVQRRRPCKSSTRSNGKKSDTLGSARSATMSSRRSLNLSWPSMEKSVFVRRSNMPWYRTWPMSTSCPARRRKVSNMWCTARSRAPCAAMRLRGEKTCVAAMPRRVFHRGSELGSHTMDRSACASARLVSGMVRAAMRRSCLVNASHAAPREETNTVLTTPSFSVMTGPWACARRARLWWRLPPRRSRRFPTMGSGRGPGGHRREPLLVYVTT
uniref:Uncharacterized protein n=1 Tax=Arundo donax TaxID=35708 RepID=A0A0A9E9Z0_ARUDO